MIDKETVKKVAELARIELSEEELERFTKELEEIDKAFSKIQEVDTSNVEPAFHPIEIENIWREDVFKESFSQEEALSNTEHKENGYFKGPRIV